MSTDNSNTNDVLKTFLPYKPHAAPSDVYCALFIALTAAFLWKILRRREWWFLCLPIGTLIQGIGYVNRVKFGHSQTFGLYFSGDLFVTVAPVSYLAFNYIIFGRFCYNTLHDERVRKTGSLAIIPAGSFKTIFVLSDVTTFLAQTSGGMMQIFDSVASIGHIVLICGIVTQAFSYAIFTALVIRSQYKWSIDSDTPLLSCVQRIYLMLYFSSGWILLRSIYRCIELPTRPDGALAKSEVAFFILDATPLFAAIAIYVLFWPSSILSLKKSKTGFQETGQTLRLLDTECKPDKFNQDGNN